MRTLCMMSVLLHLGVLLAPVMVDGQEATPDASSTEEGVVFRLVLPAELIPNPIGHVAFNRYVYEPRLDIAVDSSEEWVRSRVQLIEVGSLRVTPVVDALVWRGEAVIDGEPETLAAGKSVDLGEGDIFFLPAIAQTDADRLSESRFENTSDAETTTFGFHLHEPDAQPYSGLPSGLTHPVEAIVGGEKAMQPFADQGGVVELTLMVVQPGESISAPQNSALGIYAMQSGTGQYQMTKSESATPSTEMRWREGSTNSISPFEGVEQAIVNQTDEPIEILELVFLVDG